MASMPIRCQSHIEFCHIMNDHQMNRIQLLKPDIPPVDEILPYLRQIDASRWYTNFGPLVNRLEQRLADAFGAPVPSVVTTSSCTLGLELSLAALGLAPGARVLVPALTFVATAAAVLRAGCVPVLADVNEQTWLMDPAVAHDVLARLDLDCVMPVTTFGCRQPADVWDRFTRTTGIPVVIDAAGAFGNQEIGELTAAVFSFHATKALGIGEGGLVAARNQAWVEQVRRLSNFGIDLSTGVSTMVGTNAKMSEYHAAVGLAALDRWSDRKTRRQHLAAAYGAALRTHCPQVRLQARPSDGSYTIMQLLLPVGVGAGEVALRLRTQGIETRAWYQPLLDQHPAFSRCVVDGDLPVARMLAPRMLGVPFHLELDQATVGRICAALSSTLPGA
jgi:dTDP-4-amino-4,6-dideoxygalactose transaminase